ncbi:MAG: deoxyribose-phosphate aldolase [Myxococcota bacterium]|jgi:deoxyribose-phosphate aldolase|nr:deoxyribose-phosphate aldolase [Myxococcota bacterium]
MAEHHEFENLIDVIAERVRDRLGLQGESECEVCGVPPYTEPRPDIVGLRGDISPKDIARVIDHTYLKPDASREEIENLCREARRHNFFSVCVNSSMVQIAKSMLHGSQVKVCAVVGFPLGAGTPGAKSYEAREAVRCGADEIDMVINVGALRSRDYTLVQHDIDRIVKAVQPRVVKVIIESSTLAHNEKVIACALAKAAGAHFVKTSTGFSTGGATVEDIKLMREVVGPGMGVKASGGVRDLKTALAMLKAGASRLGTSSSVAIVTGGRASAGGY